MHRLHSILKRSMAELQAVPWARVPVGEFAFVRRREGKFDDARADCFFSSAPLSFAVKFVDPKSGIDVDIK